MEDRHVCKDKTARRRLAQMTPNSYILAFINKAFLFVANAETRETTRVRIHFCPFCGSDVATMRSQTER